MRRSLPMSRRRQPFQGQISWMEAKRRWKHWLRWATAVRMRLRAVRKVTDVPPDDVEAILEAALKNL